MKNMKKYITMGAGMLYVMIGSMNANTPSSETDTTDGKKTGSAKVYCQSGEDGDKGETSTTKNGMTARIGGTR